VTSTLLTRGVLGTAVATLAIALSACSSDASSDSSASSGTATSTSPSTVSAAPADGPFGPGCAAIPAESFTAMAAQPVVVAGSSNPALSTFVQAVTAANLGESLNTQQNITVLVPADSAFQAVPADALHALMADSAQLTAVLLHHVVQGRLTPAQLAGVHTTLNNDRVTIAGSGESFTIPGDGTIVGTDASVICGNVQTANATVYIVDQVLEPAQ
jgi:uncharacterized surface protein with fasciclin (FAS1) repeats